MDITDMSQLIDCSEEDFREYCKDKDLGYVSSLHNLFLQTYNQVSDINKSLVQTTAEAQKRGEPTEKHISTLEGLHSKLLRIEQRVFILREIIASRRLDS